MTDRLPISVFVIAKNEADRIPLTIRSVRDWVDEVIVIDSGSRDDTVKTAESLGARVTFNEWQGYGQQKVFGETLCRNNWVLNLDADEEVSPELAAEIQREFTQGPKAGAYTVRFYPIYAHQRSAPRWMVHKRAVRLYRRDVAGFKDHVVHDEVIVASGSIHHFTGPVMHRSWRSVSHHIDKINSYSDMQAEELHQRGRKANPLMMITVFPFAFLKSYFLRRQFLNGIDGVTVSLIYAMHRYIRQAKLRELYRKHDQQ